MAVRQPAKVARSNVVLGKLKAIALAEKGPSSFARVTHLETTGPKNSQKSPKKTSSASMVQPHNPATTGSRMRAGTVPTNWWLVIPVPRSMDVVVTWIHMEMKPMALQAGSVVVQVRCVVPYRWTRAISRAPINRAAIAGS